MNIFANLTVGTKWSVQNTRSLIDEEKQLLKCAIVVKSQYYYSLELWTDKGLTHIPISKMVDVKVGQVVDIDKIKILTLTSNWGDDPIYRVEF